MCFIWNRSEPSPIECCCRAASICIRRTFTLSLTGMHSFVMEVGGGDAPPINSQSCWLEQRTVSEVESKQSPSIPPFARSASHDGKIYLGHTCKGQVRRTYHRILSRICLGAGCSFQTYHCALTTPVYKWNQARKACGRDLSFTGHQ
jgi:hypothetical protein